MPMPNITYSIQGLRNGEWITLFSPIATRADAQLRLRELMKTNPACRYRLRWISRGRTRTFLGTA